MQMTPFQYVDFYDIPRTIVLWSVGSEFSFKVHSTKNFGRLGLGAFDLWRGLSS